MCKNKVGQISRISYDAVIIGGGASGLMCAIKAKEKNKNIKIAIIEKNDRVGKKLMSTGNGRCNFTNKNISCEKYTGSFKTQSRKIFERFDGRKIADEFSRLGLQSFFDNEGRFYPTSKHASSVLDVLRLRCTVLKVDMFLGQNIHCINKSDKKFAIKSYDSEREYEFSADKLVIACGSKASPKLGGTASAADYLKNFGHNVIPFSPALCPVSADSQILKALKGLRMTGKAALYSEKDEIIKAEYGEIQFTENSLSGICVFNLSLYAQKGNKIVLDLLPSLTRKEAITVLNRHRVLFADFPCEAVLTGIFQKRAALAILKHCKIDINKKTNLLNEKEAEIICDTAKHLSFCVRGKEGFDRAQTSLGGVSGKEIDENSMESKLVKNLFVCGEAIDLCGECGGYNLHFAFASGIIAGGRLCD